MKWTFDSKKRLFGAYYLNGWEVFSNSFEWKVKRPDGYIYNKCFRTVGQAQAFAENRINN